MSRVAMAPMQCAGRLRQLLQNADATVIVSPANSTQKRAGEVVSAAAALTMLTKAVAVRPELAAVDALDRAPVCPNQVRTTSTKTT
eukprot:2467602-Pyramimonas_sp.AAC.1